MPVKTYTWVSLWFLLSAPIVLWDAGYCFMRPRSMRGGDLHWLWKPYAIYQDVDLVYGLPTLKSGDGFPAAQSFLNVIETFMNILYLYLAHVAQWPAAPLIGFASIVMTFSKTLLYFSKEYFCNYCSIGHNSLDKLIIYYIIPNGLWIVVPLLIIRRLGKDIATSLINPSAAASKKKQ